jgi:TRAP-type mannitol/chloroaromatic compound transport system permease small subunit
MDKLKIFVCSVDAMNEWIGKKVSFLIVFAMCVLLYEITSRYVFHSPTLWAHEVSHHFYGAHFMLGGAYALLHRMHVRTDVVVGLLTARSQAIVAAIVSVVFFYYIGLLLWNGSLMAWTSILRNEYVASVFRSPLWPAKLTIPIGAFLLLMQGIANLIRDVYFASTGRRLV